MSTELLSLSNVIRAQSLGKARILIKLFAGNIFHHQNIFRHQNIINVGFKIPKFRSEVITNRIQNYL